MADTLNTLQTQNDPEPAKPGKKMTIFWAVMLALLVGNVFAAWRTMDMQERMLVTDEKLQDQIIGLEERTQDLTVRADTQEVILRSELTEAQKSAEKATVTARKQAERKAQLLMEKMATQSRQQHAEVIQEIGKVKSSAEKNDGEVFTLKNDVGAVRGDLKETNRKLEATREELRAGLTSMKGDLGVQSGLIATNAKELSALRQIGERHYYEFTIAKTKQMQRIGHIGLVLRKVKPKKGKFTMDVIADDRKVEKKDRTINEPIQFYVSGSRIPYEIVVNEVKKDRITGYLSVPKMLRAAAR